MLVAFPVFLSTCMYFGFHLSRDMCVPCWWFCVPRFLFSQFPLQFVWMFALSLGIRHSGGMRPEYPNQVFGWSVYSTWAFGLDILAQLERQEKKRPNVNGLG
jgi:hypothetical protein